MFNTRRLYMLNRAISELKILKKMLPPKEKDHVNWIISMVEQGKMDVQIALEEAMNLGYRNSEFDDDWVGRPDDDFDE